MERKYLSKVELDKLITSAGKRSIGLQKDIHKAALSAMKHAADCGDIGPANRLLEALGKGQRRAALVVWFCDLGTFRKATKEDNEGRDKPLALMHQKKAFLEDEAWSKPYYDYTADTPERQPLDGWKAIDSLLKRLENAAESGNLQGLDLTAVSKIKASVEGLRPLAADQTEPAK